MVWSELFCRCDHPSVDVRWSSFEALAADGTRHHPRGVTINYQGYRDGGCGNTNSWVEGSAIRQVSNTERGTPQGSMLLLESPEG